MSSTEVSEEKIQRILDAHRRWIERTDEGERADLCGLNLRGRNFSDLPLPAARFYRADLKGADLSGSDLRWGNFVEADLSWANLSRCDLRGCDFRAADLRDANFSGADMREAVLAEADYEGATFSVGQLKQWAGEIRRPNED